MRLLFVGGCERSGTTLVQRLLCSHSRIAGGPEFVFTWRVAELYERMRADYSDEFTSRLSAFYDETGLKRAFRDFLTGFFADLAERLPGALYFSEKTPSNIRAAKTLLELFPEARFLHVIRDGRDVLASHQGVAMRLRAQGRRHLSAHRPRAVGSRWNAAIDAHFDLEADVELDGRYHMIRYEELVEEPELVLGRLFTFLDLDLERAVLEPGKTPPERSGLVVDDIWVTEDWVDRGFDTAAVGRWRADLPVVTRLFTEAVVGKNLQRLGYPVAAFSLAASLLLHRLAAQRRSTPSQKRAQARSR